MSVHIEEIPNEDLIPGNPAIVISQMIEIQDRIDDLESQLKKARAEFTEKERQCVRLFQQYEIQSMTISDFTVSPKLPAYKIYEERREDAFSWLRENGYENAIKQSQPTIHHQTLSSLMRERAKNGDDIPDDLIYGSNIGKMALKRKKEK